MKALKTLGNETHDRLAQCLRDRASKHLLGGRVKQHDALVEVNRDNRVHG